MSNPMIEAMLADVYSPEMPEAMKAKLRAALEAAPCTYVIGGYDQGSCKPVYGLHAESCAKSAAKVLLDWMADDED